MLIKLKYIQNVGRFETVTHDSRLTFKKLGLVFSENGQGKTTLCAIMRSLTTGDPAPILERHRLSAKTPSKVVLEVDGSKVAFDGGAWTSSGPEVLIFDDHFVETNIYSGLNVTPGNSQNLHALVIGEEGVKFNRKVQDLTESIAALQTALREKARAIPANILGALSTDDFCNLPLPNDLGEQLSGAKRSVSLLREAEGIKKTEAFEALGLPDLGIESIEETLKAALPELASTALGAVTGHFKSLDNSQAEAWVSEGMEFSAERSSCPFCGQDLSGSMLLAHYQVYFSKAYATLKSQIVDAKSSVLSKLGGDRLARFQQKVQLSKDRYDFWSRFLSLPAFDIASDKLANCWAAARDGLVEALDKKAEGLLEPQGFNTSVREAVKKYNALAGEVLATNTALLVQNKVIAQAKEQASHGNLASAEARLARLETIERRHEKDIDAKCSEYLKTKQEKELEESLKGIARSALDSHRKKVFGTYQTAINEFLGKFNADFQIHALKPSDPKGLPSSSYELVVNRGRVGLATAKSPKPSFRTALSSGDRTTLALAFFFAMLKARADLDNMIVILDDPSSSLDDGRALSTVQEIRGLLGRAEQVIVLPHSLGFLVRIWEQADKEHTSTMQIRPTGQEASKVEGWNAEAAALTEYDRLHKLLREYSNESTGDPEKVAPALRVVLEAFLRVAFAEHLPPGKILKDFFSIANQSKVNGAPVISDGNLDELKKLREYANQFHHDTSKNWQGNLSNVNETELKGFSGRVIQFTRASYSA